MAANPTPTHPATPPDPSLDVNLVRRVAHTLRGIAMDATRAANSGHPGMPLGMADAAATLWLHFMKDSPKNAAWPDRDRFVLSAGHGSTLLYGLLHLAGYNLPLDEIKRFRQWGSMTPGHPEVGETPGVETTTGPLGAGFSNGVGMALAAHMLAARFNSPETALVDHWIYGIVSDGDLMEGVAAEAASFAGHHKLDRIIYLYDDNNISIEGNTSITFAGENVPARFEAYGWHVQSVDGRDIEGIAEAIRIAQNTPGKPHLIATKTIIGWPSPKQNDPEVHGSPLHEEEIVETKKVMGWPTGEKFFIPEDVAKAFEIRRQRNESAERKWKLRFEAWRTQNPDKAKLWDAHHGQALPDDAALEALLPNFVTPDAKPIATRQASGKTINALAKSFPWLVGGSADLAPSTNTLISGGGSIAAGDFAGRNIHFGVREHGMGGIMNGMALHGGFRVYGATFLVFSDYMRGAVRLAALSHIPVIYVFTHDSIFLGEDGPTHQPVEHLAALRCIPNLVTIRPGDPQETAQAWAAAIKHTKGPVAIVLSRQATALWDRPAKGYASAAGVHKGGYVLSDSPAGKQPELILIATGSEIGVTVEAADELRAAGRAVRVVSMPSWELFEAQSKEYRDSVLPPAVRKRMAIEAATPFGWERYVGTEGIVIGMTRFGASAPAKVLAEKFGFTRANIVAKAQQLLS